MAIGNIKTQSSKLSTPTRSTSISSSGGFSAPTKSSSISSTGGFSAPTKSSSISSSGGFSAPSSTTTSSKSSGGSKSVPGTSQIVNNTTYTNEPIVLSTTKTTTAPATNYTQQVNDYQAKQAGTYGILTVPTSQLTRAINQANSAKQYYDNGVPIELTQEQKVAVELSPYFEKGKGNYGRVGQEQAERYYASVGLTAPRIESVADRPIEQQQKEGIFYSPDKNQQEDIFKPQINSLSLEPQVIGESQNGIIVRSPIGSKIGGFLYETKS